MEMSVPVQSLKGSTTEGTKDLQLRLYLMEVDRQARLAAASFDAAWTRALQPTTPLDDPQVWALLQSGLFSAIVVSRILRPTSVRARPGVSTQQARELADERGDRLRLALHVADDSALLAVSSLRDPLEHFDERLDAVVEQGWYSVTDWWICHGLGIFAEADPSSQGSGLNRSLRTFHPTAGLIDVGHQRFDFYELTLALVRLVHHAIPAALEGLDVRAEKRRAASGHGHNVFGAGQVVELVRPATAGHRYRDWLTKRTALGAPIVDPPEPIILAVKP